MSHIKILAVDPSLRGFGMSMFNFHIDSMHLDLLDMKLVVTANEAGKDVRKSSDDLRRARELHQAFTDWAKLSDICISEVPSGAQSARAMLMNGVMVGLLASCPVPLIEVQPKEVKKAIAGRVSVSKEEIIEWAVKQFPDAPWKRYKRHGEMHLSDNNEHLADACGIAYAGVRTQQFRQLAAALAAVQAKMKQAA